MKKVKSLLSLLALSTLLFTACNNGAYDANPNGDLSDIPNPFEFGGASIGGPGYIKGNFNGQEYLFSPATWVDYTTVGRAASGIRRNDDGTLKDEFTLIFNSYPNGGDSVLNVRMTYTIFLNDTTIKEAYTNDFAGMTTGMAFITGFDWYTLMGKFSGILLQEFPGDPNKKFTITQGFFDAGKHP